MSLFGSINMAGNTLQAAQIGLQVVGQNIANANTPGYIREEVVLTPAPTQRLGNVILGLGVQVDGVIQIVDQFLEERLREAISDRARSANEEQAYLQIESIINELSENDLSTSLSRFFGSIAEIANQPENRAVRNLAVLNGEILAGDIVRMANRVVQIRLELDNQVQIMADDINRLTREISELNVRIAETEGGGTSSSDAVGLRDARQAALAELSEIVDIRSEEQLSGGVSVHIGSTYLVFEGIQRDVEIQKSSDRGITVSTIVVVDTQSSLESASGKLAGVTAARDQIVGGFLDSLDDFAKTLAVEFNKIYASGQGLSGFQSLTSEFGVDDSSQPLDAAALPFLPETGSFEVKIRDKQTNLSRTHVIHVALNGLENDTTMDDLLAELAAIDGLSATLTVDRRLQLEADSANKEFAFGNDTSGLLASLGINTFFSGTSATDLGVQEILKADPGKFAASTTGIGEDTENALALAAFADRRLDAKNDATLTELYDQLTAGITQGASTARAVADGFRSFEAALKTQSASISGVNLDEEAVRLITYQRMYQASARFIAAISELLEQLVNI
jgi:flagellar hook-associated protein 1 FlgK